ncbi:MAG: hypothetical protein HY360_26535 [Verrucomicrobia bacterium]|nr:hypothetical protein [Verrucomicrobiota bacterium]
MNSMPPDWNNDRNLWDAMGKLPENRLPSNFAYMVRQKLKPQAKTVPMKPVLPVSWLSIPLRSLFGGWPAVMAVAVACLALLLVLMRQPEGNAPEVVRKVPQPSPVEEVELAQLAQHYELIQDLEVIENLDEL